MYIYEGDTERVILPLRILMWIGNELQRIFGLNYNIFLNIFFTSIIIAQKYVENLGQ